MNEIGKLSLGPWMVDTSVWVEAWSSKAKAAQQLREHLKEKILENKVVINNLILCEILKGSASEAEIEDYLGLLESIPIFPLETADSILAGKIFSKLKLKKIKPKTPDLLIASQCIRLDLSLWTLDQDFKKFEAFDLKFVVF